MRRDTYRVWIDCDPTELFSVLMDPAANRRWQTGVVQTTSTSDGEAAVGMTMTERREFAGYQVSLRYRLVEMEWAQRAVVELLDGPLRGTASYRCRALNGGTELTIALAVAPQGRWRCAARAVAAVMTAELAFSCQRLKALLEQPAAVRAA